MGCFVLFFGQKPKAKKPPPSSAARHFAPRASGRSGARSGADGAPRPRLLLVPLLEVLVPMRQDGHALRVQEGHGVPRLVGFPSRAQRRGNPAPNALEPPCGIWRLNQKAKRSWRVTLSSHVRQLLNMGLRPLRTIGLGPAHLQHVPTSISQGESKRRPEAPLTSRGAENKKNQSQGRHPKGCESFSSRRVHDFSDLHWRLP